MVAVPIDRRFLLRRRSLRLLVRIKTYDQSENSMDLWIPVIAACAVWLVFPRDPNQSGAWEGLPLGVGTTASVKDSDQPRTTADRTSVQR